MRRLLGAILEAGLNRLAGDPSPPSWETVR